MERREFLKILPLSAIAPKILLEAPKAGYYIIPDNIVHPLAVYYDGVLFGPVIEGAKRVCDV